MYAFADQAVKPRLAPRQGPVPLLVEEAKSNESRQYVCA